MRERRRGFLTKFVVGGAGGVLVPFFGDNRVWVSAQSEFDEQIMNGFVEEGEQLWVPQKPVYDDPPTSEQIGQIKDIISSHFIHAGLNYRRALSVAECESRFNPHAINLRSGAKGLFQFVDMTWRNVLYKYLGRDDLNVYDPVDNTVAAVALWRREGSVHWEQCR